MLRLMTPLLVFFFFQAEDGIRDLVRSRGLGDVYKRQSEFLERVLEEDEGPVLLDFEKIDTLDSTGLGELIGYLQRFEERDRRMAIVRPRDRVVALLKLCLLYTSPSPRDRTRSRMPSSA